jgi:hypothetical protein
MRDNPEIAAKLEADLRERLGLAGAPQAANGGNGNSPVPPPAAATRGK